MFDTYRALIATPGGLRFSLAGFIARMPIAMDGLALIFIVLGARERYAIAGALAAVAAITTAIATPFWSKRADRFGQRTTLMTAVPIRISAITFFIVAVELSAPIWSWFILIIIAESSSVSIGSMVRRRWLHIIDPKDRDIISTSYAYESLIDEMVFIAGPIIATAAATLIAPSAGLIVGIFFLAAGVPLIISHRESEPPATPQESHGLHGAVFKNRSLQSIAIPLAFAGGCFSGIGICVVAFTDERGMKSMSGVLLGIWAAGSAISALINGAVKWKISHGSRFKFYMTSLTVMSLTFPFISNIYLLGLALFLHGLSISPLLPNGLPIVESAVPKTQITEAISWVTAGLPLTGAASSFLAGWSIDKYGVATSFWIPALFMVMGLMVAIPYLSYYRAPIGYSHPHE